MVYICLIFININVCLSHFSFHLWVIVSFIIIIRSLGKVAQPCVLLTRQVLRRLDRGWDYREEKTTILDSLLKIFR